MISSRKLLIVLAGCCLILAAGNPLQTSWAYTHTVLVEEASATWCPYCPSVVGYLTQIYGSGLYDFYFLALVTDMSSYAYSRAIYELGVPGYPTCVGDGGYQQVVGAAGSTTPYINMINTCGMRTVADVDLLLDVTWEGNAQVGVNLDIINNQATAYNGHLHVYVTEIDSRWSVFGTQYHYAMIGDYAFNQNVSVSAGDTSNYSTIWNGNAYGFGNITADNIMVIATVFSTNNWADETAAGQPELTPPSVTIDLTPHNPPIYIPSTGGSFDFDIAVENISDSTVTFDVWTEVLIPTGSVVGPILLRTGVSLPAGSSAMRTLTQSVPGTAPPGYYNYRGYVGTYPDVVQSQDSFNFAKLSDDSGPIQVFDWSICGWEDEFEATSASIPPAQFALEPPCPNPFNPQTTIRFDLPEASSVTLAVYDLAGREVARLADGFRSAGQHQVTWDASAFPSGVYIYRLTTGHFTASGKMILMK